HRDGASDPRPLSLNAFDGLRPKRLRSCVFRLAGAFSWPPCDRGWRGYFACDLFIGVENVTNVGNGIIDEGHVRGRAGGGRAPKAWERHVPARTAVGIAGDQAGGLAIDVAAVAEHLLGLGRNLRRVGFALDGGVARTLVEIHEPDHVGPPAVVSGRTGL